MRKKWKKTKRQKQRNMVSYIAVGTRDAQVASIIFYLPTTPHKLIEVTSSVFCYSGKDLYTPRTILSRLLPGFVRSCSVTQRATRHRGICWLSNELVYELGKNRLCSCRLRLCPSFSTKIDRPRLRYRCRRRLRRPLNVEKRSTFARCSKRYVPIRPFPEPLLQPSFQGQKGSLSVRFSVSYHATVSS